VDFDAVESGGFGILGGFFETSDNAGNLVVAQFTRRDIGFFAFGRVNLVTRDRNGARSDGLDATIEQRMTGTSTASVTAFQPCA
jgi:hypothetical protein